MKQIPLSLLLVVLMGCATGGRTSLTPSASLEKRARRVKGCFGTYNAVPRLSNGRTNIDRLLNDLVELEANTYHWLIWHRATDWEDLKSFLPRAREKKINVWVTVVPPSESPPHTKRYAEPFRLDYERWAIEIAQLGMKEPNLVAWSIDDFSHNLKFFTPEKLKGILDTARQINPQLAFIPCCYYRHVTPRFAENYGSLLDGILFPYRAESSQRMNLQDATLVESEVRHLRTQFREEFLVILNVYASAHSSLGPSTPEYVKEVMLYGRKSSDGILIYCHQDKERSPEKYEVLKDVFRQW